MKWKNSVLLLLLILTLSCENVYDGGKRYVIEGKLLDGVEVVENEEVVLFSKNIDNYKISEEEKEKYRQPAAEMRYEGGFSFFSTVTTDENGNFKFGFPGGDDWVFSIKVKDSYYGYFSYRNMPDYYYDIGEMTINEE